MAIHDKPASVLILDTDKVSVHQLTDILVKAGYEVKITEKPSIVIEKVKANQVDAFIVAVEILDAKGYDLIPAIKMINRCIPIIVTSADDSVEIATKVREHGVFFYAIKPLDMKEIKIVVKNAINKKFKNTQEMDWVDKEGLSKGNFEEEVLDVKKACKVLKLSKTTVNKLVKNGELPAVRIGDKWRFNRDQLLEWLRVTGAGNQKNYGTLILETMDEGVAVVDRQLRIVSCNNAYRQSLDIPCNRIIGEHCYRVSHRSTTPCEESTCPVRQAFKTERPVKLMHINYDDEGKEHYCDVLALPIKDEQGRIAEIIEVIRDNTEIYNLNKHLCWVIDFVAHELKGPLGSVMMNISALVDKKLCHTIDKNKRNEMLLASLGSLKLMHDMIRNYLISSKGKKGQLQFNLTIVDINDDVYKPAIDELKPVILKKEMTIETKIQAERPVYCDRDLMKIVFSNLISNAAKYGTTRTKIQCTITVREKEFEFNIFNEGIGIPMEKLTEVFGEFTRFDSTGIGGTGLGLYVVKMIVDMHKGKVKAESGYIVDESPVTYDEFYTDMKFYDLKKDEKVQKKFARFILKIPDKEIFDTKSSTNSLQAEGDNGPRRGGLI